ncbi:TPA: fimbria/pilus outer membrane usher protein [Salmonella enterica subsp. enterica serovar Stanley]|nr:outer membrane usher protein PefC [Salmonella enterica]EDJ8960929.1 outer membrane usher protein PefC [Salmonella enterica subsp. enterica serovar Stanley]EAW6691130.1 outer membrane usher protein PefC [Salmonella enterica]EDR6426692.1 fimbria/pilus outer membrane usher protein [Salmonella enterica]EHI5874229.1 fimbria/pilus outer membrane usher protein [Salmonella enterica]
MDKILKQPVLSLLSMSIGAATGFYSVSVTATEINTAFMQGTTDVPSVLKDGVKYPAGQYYVDVMLNGTRTGRMPLTISPDDEHSGQLCLSPEWLQNAGIFFLQEPYEQTFDRVRGCYALGRKESTHLNMDMGAQTLDFVIPQAWMPEKNDAVRWDYGISGLRLKYNGNFNKNVQSDNSRYGYNDDTLNAYGNFNASLNLGRWILSSDMTGTRNTRGSEFTTSNMTLSTAISQIKGDLMLGRALTRTELFSDFGFYGAAVRSNSNMRSWRSRGYAPVITGVAASASRITVSQDGYTVLSRTVPPGPWRLDDISAASNGSLVVTVEDNSGHKSVTEYPVSTLPSLLRPGDYAYNVAVGQRNDTSRLSDAFSSGNGTFTLASVDLGFQPVTLNTATLLHNRYQAAGLGVTRPLGEWGALSASVSGSRAEYDDGSRRKGVSATVRYAKSFTNNTDIQLLTYRYQSPGYTEFANWRPDERYRCNGFGYPDRDENLQALYQDGQYRAPYQYTCFTGREKARYEARLSHWMDRAYLSGSFWQQTYWGGQKDALGASLSASTSIFDGVSVYLNGNWSRSAWSALDDYSGSLGVSIPFTLDGVRHYSSNTVGYSRYGGASFNTGSSAMLSDRLNYSVNAGTDERSNSNAGASVSYAFDRMLTSMAVSQSRDTTTLSGNVSGSAIATAQTGLLLTKESSDTVAILRIKDTPGVTFNGSLPTNSNGNTVVYLSGYNPTTISINPENVPEGAELLNTSYEVVPTEKAIIYREFGFRNVQRYILRVRDAQGDILTGGSATTEQGLDAGFITSNGVLLMNLLAAPQKITIRQSNGKQCSFAATGLKADVSSVQETRCE